MRPVRLTMKAFGPYRDEETIDFAPLEEHRLFVISGVTGAGKTSIFDAICYALYGAASGEDRAGEVRMLRSDFASDDEPTSVDFTFRIGTRLYRVFRQMAHRRKGNKNETGGKAELYEIADGRESPCVDRFMLKDVNEKLEQLIGLNKDQFGQIVMLPQGEFRKLLTSDTENKEEILRRIFRTGLFRKLEDRFYRMSRELKDRHAEAKAKLDVYLAQAADTLPVRGEGLLAETLRQDSYNAGQLAAALKDEIGHYERSVRNIDASRSALDGRIRQAQEELTAGAARNARFAEREAKRTALAEMERQAAQMDELEKGLQDAERAARIEPYAEIADKAGSELAARRAALADKRRDVETAEAAAQAAEEAWRREEAAEPERKAADKEAERLAELEPAVKRLEEERRSVEALAARRRQESAGMEKLAGEGGALSREKGLLQEQVKRLEERTRGLPEKQVARDSLRRQFSLLNDMLAMERRLAEAARLESERAGLLERLREQHARAEEEWLTDQAGLLAAHLHDGSPCPVCGSTEHPAKASADGRIPSREALQVAKEQLMAAEREVAEAQSQTAAARSNWAIRSQDLAEYALKPERIAEQKANVEREGMRLKEEIEQLSLESAQLEEQRKKLERTEEALARLERAKEELAKSLQDVAIRHSTAESLLAKELERIPEALRSAERLAVALGESRSAAERLRRNWQQAQTRHQDARMRLAEEKARAEQLGREAEEAEKRSLEAAERFRQELALGGFLSAEAYMEAQLPESERQRGRSEIQSYRQARASLADQLAALDRELTGKSPAALDELKEAAAALKREMERLLALHHAAERNKQEAERLLQAVSQSDAAVRELEKELAMVVDVHQTLKGDNAAKVSFERYILIEFMEQILHAANERLRELSGGQFRLQLSDRLEARGRQSGLGLDVYDAYTGQNRDVKTLSGGEKFNASLSLALGMTDVIQANRGGVSIEMMFIDEGFGTLDEESLNKAVATLVGLQRAGRMIGVISHVAEMKMAFPAILEVQKTREGYSRTKITVK